MRKALNLRAGGFEETLFLVAIGIVIFLTLHYSSVPAGYPNGINFTNWNGNRLGWIQPKCQSGIIQVFDILI